jgi:uncharacterized membrane protein YcaP (DUF421 family)
VRVLVVHGQVRRGELRRCGLTDNELVTHLRQRGVFSPADLRCVLYEAKGSFAIAGEDAPADPDPELVRVGLKHAAGYR